jgi:anaerobic magnesium-protoporphyrin IX monomethyl ester cyclase
MKVLLINPPVRDFYNTPLRRLPLGLLYIASALRESGHEVRLLDSGAHRRSSVCAPPPSVDGRHMDAYDSDSSPFGLFGRFRHHGPSYEEIEERVATEAPDAVGIASLFSPYAREAEETAEAVRRAAPDAAIVLGGGHPSAFPAEVLKRTAADFVVAGEGERAFPALLDAIAAGRGTGDIPGVVSRRPDGAIHTALPAFEARLDSLPYPARDLIDPAAYLRRGVPFTQIVSSRGCPLRCSFCSARLTAGTQFRPRSSRDVVAEMKQCRAEQGTGVFDFEDDNLTFDRDRALRLLRLIASTFGKGELRLEALNGLSCTGLEVELLGALRDAGFRTLHMAPLTTCSESLTSMNREGTLGEFLKSAREAREMEMTVTAYLMVGFPGQTIREIMTSLDAVARERVHVVPSIFYPAAGSTIQSRLLPHLADADSEAWAAMRSSAFPEVPGGLSRVALRTIFWMTRLSAFATGLEPEGKEKNLTELCRGTSAARSPDAPHRRGAPWGVKSPRALTTEERGLEALGAYLRTLHPHGIRLTRRGKKGSSWRYEVFSLPGLFEDKSFYRSWGVPGFGDRR